jgi:N6-L-threonylcarbamoyladenine synthase
MRILAIETSCDETAIAIVETEKNGSQITFTILANRIASQVKIHKLYGGVVPNLAKREHIKNLPILLTASFADAHISHKKPDIDAVAVTHGPGLEPALWTGINFAEKLSEKWNVPIVPVNHLAGHIYSALMHGNTFTIPSTKIFPLLTLIVSGGHTELVFSKKHGGHTVVGETLDDAAGEAFDKVARMLGLGYPGGPEIAKLAKKATSDEKLFPRPMIHSKDLNFSFSGLKTAVLYELRGKFPKKNSRWGRAVPTFCRDGVKEFFFGNIPRKAKITFATEFQQAVVDVLVKKTLKAIELYKPKTIALGGGVSANDHLRETLSKKIPGILLPEKQLTGDNAAMIAVAAYFTQKKKASSASWRIKAHGRLRL